MIDFDAIRLTLVKGLSEYLGVSIIRSNQTGDIPKYPYLSYTITTPMSQNNGSYGAYSDGSYRKPYTQTWSVTAVSDDYSECVALACKAHDWLEEVGTVYLTDNNVVVQSVGGISPRDNMLTVEYEYRNGFDMVLWLMNKIVYDPEMIEAVTFDGKNIEPPKTVSELNEELERRLDGD